VLAEIKGIISAAEVNLLLVHYTLKE